jgi:ribosomal protein L11 methylase PrmA
VVANLTAPILRCVAEHIPPPDRLICSGVLIREADEVTAAFARTGLALADRRESGDWAALLLASAGGDMLRP